MRLARSAQPEDEQHDEADQRRERKQDVLTQGPEAVDRYLVECRELGFDIVEISSGFVTVPIDDLVALTRTVQEAGLKAKPEVGIRFGAGAASTVEALEAQGTRDVGWTIDLAKRQLPART